MRVAKMIIKSKNKPSLNYEPRTDPIIADVKTTRAKGIAGEKLDINSQMILEVPAQNGPIPRTVLDYATQKKIIIRDINGHPYNTIPSS